MGVGDTFSDRPVCCACLTLLSCAWQKPFLFHIFGAEQCAFFPLLSICGAKKSGSLCFPFINCPAELARTETRASTRRTAGKPLAPERGVLREKARLRGRRFAFWRWSWWFFGEGKVVQGVRWCVFFFVRGSSCVTFLSILQRVDPLLGDPLNQLLEL